LHIFVKKAMLTLSDVSKTYTKASQSIVALLPTDLCLAEGEMMAIVGASGCGKSTLLKIAGGLLSPTTGSVSIANQELTSLSPRQLTLFRRTSIGFIFQDFNLLPVLSALENIQFALELKGIKRKQARHEAGYWLEKVGLSDKAEQRPAALSGGQQQRVAIARAMAMQPLLLLADEPTSSLDGQNAGLVMELLQRLQRQTSVSVLVATHDTRLLSYMNTVIQLEN
jgi:putative ABC transport system ATP-binding protein